MPYTRLIGESRGNGPDATILIGPPSEEHRVRRLLLLLALMPSLTLLAQAPNAPTPTQPTVPASLPQAEVDALVEKLASDDPPVREEALRQLETAGIRALPALRKSINHPDAEVRRVLVDLIPNLETAALLAPRRVTMNLENKTVKDALDEVARQTGYKIQAWGNIQNPGQNFRLDDVTFWEAIDTISRQAGLNIQQGHSDDTVRLNTQDIQHPFVSRDGPYRVVAEGMHQNRSIQLTIRPGQNDAPLRSTALNFNFTVFTEPKLPIIGCGEARLSQALDNDRNSMIPVTEDESAELQVIRGFGGRLGGRFISNRYSQKMFNASVSTNLVRPSEKATSIKLLKGYIPLTVLTEQKAVDVTKELEKAKDVKLEVGTHTITIAESKEQVPGNWQVRLIITQDNGENDYSWTSSLYQRLEVYGADGTRWQNQGSSWGNNGPNLVNMTLNFRHPAGKNEKPQRLVFQHWSTMNTLAPFEFRDVPLP